MKKHKKNSIIKTIIKEHISNNLKEYIIILTIFLIGIIIGITFINNSTPLQQTEISNYLQTFIQDLNGNKDINKIALLKESITENIILVISLWFIGSTVIGIPIVYATIGFRGFSLGYTVASAIATLGSSNGTIFILSSILLQNIILIPSMLALAISGVKLYKSIIKDRRKENVKFEIIRHTIFSAIFLVIMTLASCIEVYVSTNILVQTIKFMK